MKSDFLEMLESAHGVSFEEFMILFPWESDEQKKGFFSLIQHLRSFSVAPIPVEVRMAIAWCYFIQKDHESNVWWLDTMGNQIKTLQEEIKHLRDQLEELKHSTKA